MLHPLLIISSTTVSRYTQQYSSSSQFVTGTALNFSLIFITFMLLMLPFLFHLWHSLHWHLMTLMSLDTGLKGFRYLIRLRFININAITNSLKNWLLIFCPIKIVFLPGEYSKLLNNTQTFMSWIKYIVCINWCLCLDFFNFTLKLANFFYSIFLTYKSKLAHITLLCDSRTTRLHSPYSPAKSTTFILAFITLHLNFILNKLFSLRLLKNHTQW